MLEQESASFLKKRRPAWGSKKLLLSGGRVRYRRPKSSWSGLTGPSTPLPQRHKPNPLNRATAAATSTAKDQKFFASPGGAPFFQKRSAVF
jgi:hypothetical protein